MNLIVAVDNKWGIGKDGNLLVRLKCDIHRFKVLTDNGVVVMGRKTLESLPSHKGLSNRVNIVLSSDKDYKAEGCIVVHNEDEMFKELSKYDSDKIWVIGGSSIYNRLYKYCDRLYVTKIDKNLNADTYIVNFDTDDSYKIVSESNTLTENNIDYRFVIYEKR